MTKITFIGAGSCVFAKNVLGDSMRTPALYDAHIALYDISPKRLKDAKLMISNLNNSVNKGRATITAHLGVRSRRAALKKADFVVNAIQIAGYDPGTVTDFEIPKKYGLRHTIADTLCVGGIMRGLRTIPVMEALAADIEAVCPDAWLLNYTNPMSILSGFMQRFTDVRTVGLCHSVQVCVPNLLRDLDMKEYLPCKWHVAGINHMAWLLDISKDGKDLYPEIKRRALRKNRIARRSDKKHHDMVRYEILKHFNYYNTESSEHTAEYHPYFIKNSAPELINELNIPLDEYPRRCINQIALWATQRATLIEDKNLKHKRSHEYASCIMEAIVKDKPVEIGGNVLNNGLISNLPAEACVEVPCLVNRNGVQGCHVGALPEQLAALNRTHINVHLLTIEAAVTKSRDKVYQSAMLDPLTRSELTLDEIVKMVDELLEAHAEFLPKFK
jgi:alpha-galactosidase